jgi:hexosaminidase
MDPTSEEVYEFISEFLMEMTTLFPDPFFHIGGDEVGGKQWQANPKIRGFMATEGLNDIRHLQAYFNRRLHGILQELDRELIGWDPILHPDLPAGSVVQSVRGQQWLVDAVRHGYRAIAGSEYYLTQMQPAENHYTSDPYGGVAASLTAEQQKLILGGEASIWTELASEENIDSRTWPRAAAIAERLWSPREVTDIDDMYRRLAIVSRRLEVTGVTHNTGPPRMLHRLTNYGPIEPLQILAEVVQPVSSDARKKSREYTFETPLNRLVDATLPESETARQFTRMVETFLNDPTDQTTYDALTNQLRVWRDNHDRLEPELQRSSLLAEAEPLSAMLSKVAEVGLLSLKALHNEVAVSRNERERHRVLLKQATTPVAELSLMITPGVQKLDEAIPTDV